MKWVAVILAVLGSGELAWAGDATVMVFRSGNFNAEERLLLEALRIYTRDLPCRIVITGHTPNNLDRPGLEAIAQRARSEGAPIALWVTRRFDGRTTYDLLSVGDMDVRETEIGPAGPERAAHAMALKVRTLLTRGSDDTPARDHRGVATSAAAEPSTESPRTPAVEAAGATSSRMSTAGAAPVSAPSPSAPVRRPPATTGAPPPTPTVSAALPALSETEPVQARAIGDAWLEVGASFAVASPIHGDWLRQGVAFHARVRLGPRPLILFADGTVAPSVEAEARGFETTLRDVPLGMGLEREWMASRIALAAGPRVGLHVFDAATQSADGLGGSTRRLSGGVGAGGRVTGPVGEHLKLFLAASVEALLPSQTFTVTGRSALATGPMLLQVGAGMAFAIP